jgi:hypothetical protein
MMAPAPPYAFDPRAVERALEEVRQAAGDAPRIHFGCELVEFS